MLNTNTYYQNKKSLTVNNQITNPYQANKNVSRPAFKGLYSGFTDQLAKLFGFLAKKPQMQNFVDWIAKKDVISTLAATTGILISGFYIYNTSKSKIRSSIALSNSSPYEKSQAISLKQFLQRCVQPETNKEIRTPSPLAISVHFIVA